MHSSTGVILLKKLLELKLIRVSGQNFAIPPHPEPIHHLDVKEAFIAVADGMGHDKKDLTFLKGYGLLVHAKAKLFDKLYKVIFINSGYREENMSRVSDAPAPLPTLFIGAEKTQIRQIPLVEERPFPYKFLLELGGMIVVKSDKKSVARELRQFLLNYPQIEARVSMKEWPDGSLALYTWFFRRFD